MAVSAALFPYLAFAFRAERLVLRPMPSAPLDLWWAIDWLAHGEVGPSSKALMMAVARPLSPSSQILSPFPLADGEGSASPFDVDDLRRCLVLLHRFPEIRERLDQVASISPEWARIVAHWPRLEEGFLAQALEACAKRIGWADLVYGDVDAYAKQEPAWWEPTWPRLPRGQVFDIVSPLLLDIREGRRPLGEEEYRKRAKPMGRPPGDGKRLSRQIRDHLDAAERLLTTGGAEGENRRRFDALVGTAQHLAFAAGLNGFEVEWGDRARRFASMVKAAPAEAPSLLQTMRF